MQVDQSFAAKLKKELDAAEKLREQEANGVVEDGGVAGDSAMLEPPQST